MSQTTVDSRKDIEVELVGTDFYFKNEKEFEYPPKGGIEYHHSVKEEGDFIVAAVNTGILDKDTLIGKDNGTKIQMPKGTLKQVIENQKNRKTETMIHTTKRLSSEEGMEH